MTKLNLLTAILIGVIIIIFFSGCATSSDSLRYHSASEKPNDDKSNTRFGSKEQNKSYVGIITEKNDTSGFDGSALDSDPDDIPTNQRKIDISTIIKKYNANENDKSLTPEQISAREKILMQIIRYIDTPYQYGGNTEDGIDCSAFTQSVYDKSLSIELQRSARDQYQQGDVIENKEDLQFGDLVFFNTRRRVKPGHVGIYIGDRLFAHSSSKNGVIISSLDEEYYSKRFMGGRRVEEMAGSETVTNDNNN
jgi:cell wall-associated NlpC family hydrolase